MYGLLDPFVIMLTLRLNHNESKLSIRFLHLHHYERMGAVVEEVEGVEPDAAAATPVAVAGDWGDAGGIFAVTVPSSFKYPSWIRIFSRNARWTSCKSSVVPRGKL